MTMQIENKTKRDLLIMTGSTDGALPDLTLRVKPGNAITSSKHGVTRIVIQDPAQSMKEPEIVVLNAANTEIVRQIEMLKKRLERVEVEAHDATKAIGNHVKVGDYCPHTGK